MRRGAKLFFTMRPVIFLALVLAVVIVVLTRDGTSQAPNPTPAPPSPASSTPSTPEEAALAVLRENAAAIIAKDLDRYLATLDENAPAYESTAETMRALFDSYDLDVVLEGAEVLEQTEGEIVIRLVQITRKISTSQTPEPTPVPPSPTAGALLAPEEAALAVLHENAAAIIAKDLDRYLATLDESAPSYESTADTMRVLFDSYNLDVILEGVEVLQQSDDEIVIRLVQTTRKIGWPAFSDGQRTVIHTLRPVDGAWKIYRSEIVGPDFADNKRTVIYSLRLVDGAWKICRSEIVSTEYLS